MKLKSVLMKSITAAMTLLLAVQNPIQAFAASLGQEYISDLYLSYAKSDSPEDIAAAKQWLTDNGYSIVDQNLTQDADAWLSRVRPVFLGYKTTTEKNEAITDLRVLNMTGDYNIYASYEQLLEQQQDYVALMMDDINTALKEYRENYRNDTAKGAIAYEALNKLTDPDTGMTLGDLLLNQTKEENEELWKNEPNKHIDMTTVLMTGNSAAVKAMMQDLAYASDSASDSWLDRLKSISLTQMTQKLSEENPELPAGKVQQLLKADYDADALILAEQINEMRAQLQLYEECKIHADDSDLTEEKTEAFFLAEDYDGITMADWLNAAQLKALMESYTFNGMTMLEFLNSADRKFATNQSDRIELYPLLEAMSPAQRRMLAYNPLDQLLITGMLDEAGWEETYDQQSEILESQTAMSIYEGVNRSVLDSCSIALTGDAFDKQTATKVQALNSGMFGGGLDFTAPLTFSAGIGVMTAGAVMISRGVTTTLVPDSPMIVMFKRILNENQNIINKYYDKFVQLYNTNYHAVNAGAASVSANAKPTAEALWNAANAQRGVYYTNSLKQAGMITEREADELRLAFQMKETQTMNINRAKAIGAKEAYTKTTRTWSYYAGIGVCVIAALIMIASFAIAAYQMVDYYRGDHYTPIPEFVVDTSKNVSEHVFYTYYEGVKCNRNEEGYMNGELKNEMLGDTGDLNGDVGKEWLALYWTKDTSAGAPLKAGFTVRTGESGKKTPLGSRALALFGQENALNITDEKYSYKDGLNGLYLFFKQNTSTAGAVFTAGALFVTGTLACVGGLGLGLLLSNLKKKKERDASVPA